MLDDEDEEYNDLSKPFNKKFKKRNLKDKILDGMLKI